jgi:predicted dehydrogenase
VTRPPAELNVAVVGAGLIGDVHARAYGEHPRCNLAWICDSDAARARKMARRFGCRATTKISDLARDGELHAASVATPDFAHRAPVMALLRGGKHVLCEKPLSTRAAEARAMVREARRRKLSLMVDFQNRWSPLFLEVKKRIDAGELGDLACGYARLSNTLFVPLKMLSWASKSGPEWFLLPHVLDLVRWLTGRKPIVEVRAFGRKKILRSRGVNAFDAVQTSVRFKDGSFCTFENSWVMPEAWPTLIDFSLSLQGSAGKIEVEGGDQGLSVTGPKTHATPFVLAEQNAFGRRTGFFAEPVLHFADALLDGREPECPGEDGLVATEVVAAAVKSIRTGRPVRLPS